MGISGGFWGFIKGVKFMVMELVSRLSVAIGSDSGSFQARASLSQDGCQRGVFWEVAGHVASPFDFRKFFRLVVAC